MKRRHDVLIFKKESNKSKLKSANTKDIFMNIAKIFITIYKPSTTTDVSITTKFDVFWRDNETKMFNV